MDMRKVVKEKAVRRHKFLATLLEFLKFKRDSDEVSFFLLYIFACCHFL